MWVQGPKHLGHPPLHSWATAESLTGRGATRIRTRRRRQRINQVNHGAGPNKIYLYHKIVKILTWSERACAAWVLLDCEHGRAVAVGGPAAGAAPLDLECRVGEQIRYQRAVADCENIRRRTQRCVEDAKIFGIQSFCKDLVEVADILEKTTECISEETEPGGQTLILEKVFRGLSLLQAKLKSVFAKHGLERMAPIGDKYDPHEHELICHVPASVRVQPGTLALVRQDGYKLHGCTIRLAQVEVAVESQRRL
uniref:GrpE protein homolog n=1 Tax=Oryctolagus cuniculus TaxID=9986 RepID=G1TUB2_RABIT